MRILIRNPFAGENKTLGLLRFGLSQLSKDSKHKWLIYLVASLFLSALELFSIVVFGLAVAILTAGLGVSNPVLLFAFEIVGFDSNSQLQERLVYTAFLGVFVLLLFSLKAALQVLMQTKLNSFLAREKSKWVQSQLKKINSEKYFLNPEIKFANIIQSLTSGASSIFYKVLGPGVTLISESVLVAVTAFTMILMQPLVSIGVIIYFSLVFIFLQRWIVPKLTKYSVDQASSDVATHTYMNDVFFNYREIWLAGKISEYESKILTHVDSGAQAESKMRAITQAPRIILELALVMGLSLIASVEFAFFELSTASTFLVLIVAASLRIMPSILVVVQQTGLVNSSAGEVSLLKALNLSSARGAKDVRFDF